MQLYINTMLFATTACSVIGQNNLFYKFTSAGKKKNKNKNKY
jgi:hypothetical protein